MYVVEYIKKLLVYFILDSIISHDNNNKSSNLLL